MDKPIVFYDGDCGFCNKMVQFVLKYEKHATIHFSALQSEFAQSFFQQQGIEAIDYTTFYFWDTQTLSKQSTAGLKVAKHLRFPMSWLQGFWIIPRFIRDSVYQLIANNRRKLAGTFCVVPDEKQRARFLK